MSRFYRKLVVAALLVVFAMPGNAWAWGRLGHRLVARVAEQRLSENARLAVLQLLEPGESLADASTWADDHKKSIHGSGAWHYVDVPLDYPQYDPQFAGEDPSMGCIVPKLRQFADAVADPTLPIEDRRIALRFVVHLMGDLHQPLHVGDNHDRGGNQTQVRFYDRGTNMHRLWDFNMIELVDYNEAQWLQILSPRGPGAARQEMFALAGTVEDWATESLLAARAAYHEPETGERIVSGYRLGDAYIEANLPVVRQRLYLAGARLAGTLNQIFVQLPDQGAEE
jgi:nuclease S1